MMKFIILMFFASFTIYFFSACSNRQKKNRQQDTYAPQSLLDSNYHKKKFDSLINSACKGIPSGLDYSEELLASPAFRCIFEHSSAYLEDEILLLSDRFTNLQISICIYSMQNLPLIDYVQFCKFVLKLYSSNKIPEGFLRQSIVPNFLEIRIIPKNYANPDVISLLKSIENERKISKEFKKEIEDILSGKYINNLE